MLISKVPKKLHTVKPPVPNTMVVTIEKAHVKITKSTMIQFASVPC